MAKRSCILWMPVLLTMMFATPAFTAHPLITDDTGTQGAGKFQVEVNGEYSHDEEQPEVERAVEAAVALAWGATETIDVIVGIPYVRYDWHDDTLRQSESGLSDVGIEVKWRFYEREGGSSMALKPGVSVPTGDDEKGLGTGKYGYSAFLIGTQEWKPWVLHLNFGYMRNNNKADEQENLCHLSLAAEFEATESIKIVANVGQERNPDKADTRKPRFALAGLIYAIGEDLDLDVGVKTGLNDPETDLAVLAGMALRF